MNSILKVVLAIALIYDQIADGYSKVRYENSYMCARLSLLGHFPRDGLARMSG